MDNKIVPSGKVEVFKKSLCFRIYYKIIKTNFSKKSF